MVAGNKPKPIYSYSQCIWPSGGELFYSCARIPLFLACPACSGSAEPNRASSDDDCCQPPTARGGCGVSSAGLRVSSFAYVAGPLYRLYGVQANGSSWRRVRHSATSAAVSVCVARNACSTQHVGAGGRARNETTAVAGDDVRDHRARERPERDHTRHTHHPVYPFSCSCSIVTFLSLVSFCVLLSIRMPLALLIL